MKLFANLSLIAVLLVGTVGCSVNHVRKNDVVDAAVTGVFAGGIAKLFGLSDEVAAKIGLGTAGIIVAGRSNARAAEEARLAVEGVDFRLINVADRSVLCVIDGLRPSDWREQEGVEQFVLHPNTSTTLRLDPYQVEQSLHVRRGGYFGGRQSTLQVRKAPRNLAVSCHWQGGGWDTFDANVSPTKPLTVQLYPGIGDPKSETSENSSRGGGQRICSGAGESRFCYP